MTDQSLDRAALPGSTSDRLLTMIMGSLTRLRHGSLTLTTPSGHRHVFRGEQPGPDAQVDFVRLRTLRRALTGGVLGFCESYLDGDWTSPAIDKLVEFALLNEGSLGFKLDGGALKRWIGRIRQSFQRNSRAGSRRNIAYHYDLGNAFYRLWLDDSMTYSSAVFETGDETLEEAQAEKYRRLARLMDLQPGHSVLEVGCGWGGFAEVAARDFQAQVTGITVSKEQHAYAVDRLDRAGLQDRTDIQLIDYRDVPGQFDRIASIEMFEAVGEQYWPQFFQTLSARLKPGGKAALQIIFVDDALFPRYRRNDDYIRKYIFPGGMLAAKSALMPIIRQAGLRWAEEHSYGQSYAETLLRWDTRFQAAWPEIEQLNFDDRFKRMWELYLHVCAGSFRTGRIDVKQVLLEKA